MLFLGTAAISAFAAIFVYLLGPVNHLYMIPVAFGVCFFLLLLIWAISCAICTALVDLRKPCRKHSPLFRFYANCIIDSIMQLMRVKLHITGIETLPNEPFLLVGNHRSAMDPILEMGVLRKYHIGFVAKKELYKLPLVRKIMHKCFCLPLDRDDPLEGVKTINKAAEHIKILGAVMGIYPEGTTNQTAHLLPFKNGAFKIAQKAKCPIVVAVIRNSDHVLKNIPFRKTHVYLDFIGALSTDEIENNRTDHISERVRDMMETFLISNGKKAL